VTSHPFQIRAAVARALVAVLLSAVVARAQDSTGAIEGVVRDTAARPLASAAVRVPSARQVMTDSLGRYRIDGIPPGRVWLRVFRIGYRTPVSESVMVITGSVSHADFVLHQLGQRRTVRIPCPAGTTAPGGGVCVPYRKVASLDGAPTGIGIIRDRATWDAVERRFHAHASTRRPDTAIDWNTEMLVLVSYGLGLAEMDEDWGFNRAETRGDTVVITLGPDSIVGKREMFVDGIVFPEAIAIPRSSLPVRYEMRVTEGWIPPGVDWRAVADTTP
jgi:hypothetical protein